MVTAAVPPPLPSPLSPLPPLALPAVLLVTHLHGHMNVNDYSDGYPEVSKTAAAAAAAAVASLARA